MSIIDAIKNSILEQFDTSLTAGNVIMSLLTAFLISLLIIYVYKKTFSGVVYSKGTALTILLLALATSMIIRTINANLSLSLGMVGALSIVRFRTAIKDPVDTAFLFWAVTAGIMAGAGLYIISILGSLLIAIIFYGVYFFNAKAKSDYLLIVNYEEKNEVFIKSILDSFPQKKLKSKTITATGIEVTYQVNGRDDIEGFMKDLMDSNQVKNVNLVSYTNDFGM